MRIWLLLACLAATSEASAFCSAPSFHESAPDNPGAYNKPDVPLCLQEFRWSKKHTCDRWELDRYKGEVEEYVRKLQGYVNEANTFVQTAGNYAEEAAHFANCEAEEVLSQHE